MSSSGRPHHQAHAGYEVGIVCLLPPAVAPPTPREHGLEVLFHFRMLRQNGGGMSVDGGGKAELEGSGDVFSLGPGAWSASLEDLGMVVVALVGDGSGGGGGEGEGEAMMNAVVAVRCHANRLEPVHKMGSRLCCVCFLLLILVWMFLVVL